MMIDDILLPNNLITLLARTNAIISDIAAIKDIQPIIDRDWHGAISSIYKYTY